MLDLIEKLRASSRDVAAFDLAGKFFGADFERQLRNGVDLTNQLRDTLNSTSTTVAGVRIIDPADIERANQLDAKAKDISEHLRHSFGAYSARHFYVCAGYVSGFSER